MNRTRPAAPRATSVLVCSCVLAVLPRGSRSIGAEPALVAPTSHRSPAEERAAFHLPPGFDAELVAAEPDIHKPMNIGIDDRGRIWVTSTIEYPFPAPADRAARDAVKVLDDFDENGRARKITTFADALNIPIGILPVRDGAIAHSIPNIYHFADTDGDGRADRRDVFFAGFGFNDTHGMTSGFTLGFDGWVYACHGFSNDSTLKASDGSSIHLRSGNTYRFRPDGSHIEQFTWGQINPFGLCFDSYGNLFSADCHSRPLMMLLRGGYYPSWGVSQDPLGEAPMTCDHEHASTATAGIVIYAADRFPEAYRDVALTGNVVTARINQDRLERHGSSFQAVHQPDFLVSDDPWFRPVDLKLGPDGALYVADFYNKIIGHYEVPLTHPERDRESGRIWRIVYRGSDGHGAPRTDWTRASVGDLVGDLAHPNLTVRLKATHQLVERGRPAAAAVRAALKPSAKPSVRAHGLWVLERLGALDDPTLLAGTRDADALVRVHAMRVISERPAALTGKSRDALLAGLKDTDAFVRRAAADALGRHPAWEHLRPLLDAVQQVPADDPQLCHTLRMALREQFRVSAVASRALRESFSPRDKCLLAEMALAVPTPEAASFLLKQLPGVAQDRDATARYLRHIARHILPAEADSLAAVVRERVGDDMEFEFSLFQSVQEGTAQRGAALGRGTLAWGSDLVRRVLDAYAEPPPWTAAPVEGKPASADPWTVENRDSADGNKGAPFLSSRPVGETLTGMLRSQPFALPGKLVFFIAGHNGPPGKTQPPQNGVRLRAADTREVLAEALPPRDDTAQKVTWDLQAHAGRQGFLELLDGDTGGGYAWLAVGRFDPPVAPMRTTGEAVKRLRDAIGMVAALRLPGREGNLTRVLANGGFDAECRSAAAQALAAVDAAAHVKRFGAMLRNAAEPFAFRERLAGVVGAINSPAARAELLEALRVAPDRMAVALAAHLACNPAGAEALVASAQEGKSPARLLLEPEVNAKLKGSGVAPERLAELTRGLPAADETLRQTLRRRLEGFAAAQPDVGRGEGVFRKNCALCHQIAGQGARIGPQLDGIGARGAERMIEDMLDPNRNVDPAFRTTALNLKDGRVLNGILIREEGETLVLADSQGKEMRVPQSEVETRAILPLSPMPANLADQIPATEFYDLLGFLLSQREGGTR